jgi:hypothetical protein
MIHIVSAGGRKGYVVVREGDEFLVDVEEWEGISEEQESC